MGYTETDAEIERINRERLRAAGHSKLAARIKSSPPEKPAAKFRSRNRKHPRY